MSLCYVYVPTKQSHSLANLNSADTKPLDNNSKKKYLRIFAGVFEVALNFNVVEKYKMVSFTKKLQH